MTNRVEFSVRPAEIEDNLALLGLSTRLRSDLVAGVAEASTATALEEMRAAGVEIVPAA